MVVLVVADAFTPRATVGFVTRLVVSLPPALPRGAMVADESIDEAGVGAIFGATVAGGFGGAVVGDAPAGTRSVAGAIAGTAVPFVPVRLVPPNVHNSTSPECGTSFVAPVEL
jgi:hypothetical protein